MRHHAFVIEAEAEEGIAAAMAWAERELGMIGEAPSTGLGAGNPDIVVLRYGLLSVEEARQIADVAAGAPFAGENKVVIIAASRVYHEAQNAFLKLFEEPPRGTYLFLIMPSLGGLLPTLRSRTQVLDIVSNTRCLTSGVKHSVFDIPEIAEEFLKTNKEKRSAIIKKLTSGKDEEERRELRDEAIAIVNGIEATAYRRGIDKADAALLSDIATLRGYLYDRSAPVRMILEHLSLVLPDIRGNG